MKKKQFGNTNPRKSCSSELGILFYIVQAVKLEMRIIMNFKVLYLMYNSEKIARDFSSSTFKAFHIKIFFNILFSL